MSTGVRLLCDGGFRFGELQFLQVGDIDADQREIKLDVKRLNVGRVRPELRRRCVADDGNLAPNEFARVGQEAMTEAATEFLAKNGTEKG